jgi:hypothetical protein
MEMFNSYWCSRADGLKGTAGYWSDGERFISDLLASKVISESEASVFTRAR